MNELSLERAYSRVAIIHVVESIDDNYGGPARSIPMLCKGLGEEGFHNVVVSVDSSSARNTLLKLEGIEWLKARPSTIKIGYFSINLQKLLKQKILALQSQNYRVLVHLHSVWSYPSVVVYKVCTSLNIPYILTPRSSLQISSLKKSRLIKTIVGTVFIKKLIANAFIIHVTCKSEEKDFYQNFKHDNLVLIENGLDFSEFHDLPTKEESIEYFSLANKGKCILFLSRLSERKGLDLLYDAFQIIKSSGLSDWQLLIAGPNEDVEIINSIQKKSLEDGISKSVHYVGMLRGRERLMAFSAADLFVLPTKFENFGMSIAESLAAGLPVITTKDTPWEGVTKLGFGCIASRDSSSLVDAIKSQYELGRLESKNTEMLKYVESNYNYRVKAKALGRHLIKCFSTGAQQNKF
ncbi:MAG: glycosyltransferase [Cycloclasticus sp.]|jgi:Glycosyltransferase